MSILLGALEIVGIDVIVGSKDGLVVLLDGVLWSPFFPLPILLGALEIVGIDVKVGLFDGALLDGAFVFPFFPPLCSPLGDKDGSKAGD